jgi:hypothetical protein
MAGYIGAAPVPQATQHRQAFTATAAQTSFATAGYTSQFIDVYLNGIKLAGEDYTATNGSDIVLAIGAATGDILEYVAYTPFEVADQTFTGTTTLTDSGAAPLFVNRTTSAGDITAFQKDGTTVGSIGVLAADEFYIDGVSNSSGIGFLPDRIVPRNSGVGYEDATQDIGQSNIRYKNLYLSGGVYLGGSGAANKLDDYEEGTWTPTISQGASGISYATQFGRYIKIGNMVNCWSMIIGSWTAVAADAHFGGLPFARAATDTWTAAGWLSGTGFNPAGAAALPLIPTTASHVIAINANGSGALRLQSGSNIYVEASFSYSTF